MSDFPNLPKGTFVMIPKGPFSYFDVDVGVGFCASAKEHNVDCKWISNTFLFSPYQNELVQDVVENPGKYNITKIAGIAINAMDEELTEKAIDFARSKTIPVVTYDSDAPNSKRMAFISTNSTAFGLELGKVLNQLNPIGGGYVMITGRGLNMQQRAEGVRRALKATNWAELSPPMNCVENIGLSLEIINQLGADPLVKGVISLGGWPMWDEDQEKFKEFSRTYLSKMTTVIADSSQIQIDLMNQGYVDGLVGQLPFTIGSLSFEVLMNITQGKEPSKNYYGTHLLEVLRVPLELPPVQKNYNYIGGYAALGYTFFAIVAFLSIALLFWTYVNRNTKTLRASQPIFMAMLCGGSLMMASAMIPLSITDKNFSQKGTDIACMSIPWLFTIGFCTIFSALFTKTWRIVRILKNAERFQRVKISVGEVLYPYFILLAANIIILICWSVFNPLVYERTNNTGTDGWNRIISSYGHCVSSNHDSAGASAPYLGSLAAINGGLLGLANIMAYRARNIKMGFGESQYISNVMLSMLQAFMIGVPLIFFVFNQPLAYYIVTVILDFAVCMATLLFMFVPKILAHKELLRKKKRSLAKSLQSASQDPERPSSIGSRGATSGENLNQVFVNSFQILSRIRSWFSSPSTTHESKLRQNLSLIRSFARNRNLSTQRNNNFVRPRRQPSSKHRTFGSARSAGSPIHLTSSARAAIIPKRKRENVKFPWKDKVDNFTISENDVRFLWESKLDNSSVTENALTFPWEVKMYDNPSISHFYGVVTLQLQSDDILKVDNDENIYGELRYFTRNEIAQVANNKSIVDDREGGLKLQRDNNGILEVDNSRSTTEDGYGELEPPHNHSTRLQVTSNVDKREAGSKFQSNLSDHDIVAKYNLSSSTDEESDTANFSNSAVLSWIEGLPKESQNTFFSSLHDKFVFDKFDIIFRKIE